MITFTLDTNCIIDLAENRPAAAGVRMLAALGAEGLANVALVSVSASERQLGDTYLESYDDFKNKLALLRIEHLEVLPTICYWGISFYGAALYSGADLVARERLIHETLFPTIPFLWSDFAESVGISAANMRAPDARRWRNAFCDRQMFWAHDYHRRDVFVTRDRNFRKRLSHSANFANVQIATPDEAARLV